MSEVRLLVREAGRDWSGTIHGSCADRAIAALSADPVTLDELERATGRFAKVRGRHFANLRPGLNDEPYDAGLVVIDLEARLIVVDSTYSCPERRDWVEYHNGRCATSTLIPYHLADDWLITGDRTQWRALAEQRRRERAASHRDVRAIFYGEPLLEFIAREVPRAFARRDEFEAAARTRWIENARRRLAHEINISPDQVDPDLLTDDEITPTAWPGQEMYASPFYDALKQIHANWMLTPRDDLGGVCPREIALEHHGHISRDLDDRCRQWSVMNEPPPGLEPSAHAFRYGGFGTHELVKYYELVRELLWSCWERLTDLADNSPGTTSEADRDFVASEVARLARVRDTWLDTPDPELHGRTPRSVIDRERARLPEDASGHAMIDPDCPCCQMLDDMPGPSFWHLDGCNMDDEFAFDIYHRTREEWEKERRDYEEWSNRYDAEREERRRRGEDDETPVWQASSFAAENVNAPMSTRMFGVGCWLAEVIQCLRGDTRGETPTPDLQATIVRLNRDFGNVRELLLSRDTSHRDALIGPALDRFVEVLTTVASERPDLAARCESLTGVLNQIVNQPRPEPTDDFFEDDDPF